MLTAIFDSSDPEDSHALVKHMSSHLRPMLVNSWMKRRDTVILENSEKRRKLLDNLQKQLDEVFYLLSFIGLISYLLSFCFLPFSIATSLRACHFLTVRLHPFHDFQVFLDLQLYDKALELFEDDSSVSVTSAKQISFSL